MAIVRAIGRPDLFMTMTRHPNWPELQRKISKFRIGTTCNDISNITVPLFYSKLRALLFDILSGKYSERFQHMFIQLNFQNADYLTHICYFCWTIKIN